MAIFSSVAAVSEAVSVLLLCEDTALSQALNAQLASRGRQLTHCTPAELLADVGLADGAILVNASLMPGQPFTEELAAMQRRLLVELGPQLRSYIVLSDPRVLAALGDDSPLSENATPAPQDEDGKRLAAMEEVLLASPVQSVVLRSGPLIATAGDNILSAFIRALKAGEAVGLNHGAHSCPTPVSDLARVLSAMIDQLYCGATCRGIYHYQSSGSTSAYAFAEVAYAHSSQYLAGAPDIAIDEQGWDWQPHVQVLRCERLLRNFGIKQLPWRAWLPKMIKTLCEDDYDERV